MRRILAALTAVTALALLSTPSLVAQDARCANAKYSDAHFHLTNYVQEGTPSPTTCG
jgi:hypothetical protein